MSHGKYLIVDMLAGRQGICRVTTGTVKEKAPLYYTAKMLTNKAHQRRAVVCEMNFEPQRHPLERSVSGMPLGAAAEQQG